MVNLAARPTALGCCFIQVYKLLMTLLLAFSLPKRVPLVRRFFRAVGYIPVLHQLLGMFRRYVFLSHGKSSKECSSNGGAKGHDDNQLFRASRLFFGVDLILLCEMHAFA